MGGLNAAQLWSTNDVALLTWALLAFLPRWKWTPTLSLIAPLINSVVYAGSIISLMAFGGGESLDFTSLEGIAKGFQDPNLVFVGWVHYLAFDALVGRMITLDSGARGVSAMVHAVYIVPCLFLTLMLGPVGFLLYMSTRDIILPAKKDEETYKAKVF